VSVTTGASTSSQTFTPWGAPRSGSVSATKRHYTGQYRDDTGLLYYHARYYDPVLGRFISPDTLVPDPTDPQDLNRYTYAKNNPMRYNDPTGHVADPFDEKGGAKPGGDGPAGGASGSSGAPTNPSPPLSPSLRGVRVTDTGGEPLTPKGGGGTNSTSRGYDRPAFETKSGTAMKRQDAVRDWDEFLGPNQTSIDPRDGRYDPDRIWSADGRRSVRFGAHEMNSKPNKFHYHRETWHPDKVENVLQRVQP
jgi:RHS repeat-associated protein